MTQKINFGATYGTGSYKKIFLTKLTPGSKYWVRRYYNPIVSVISPISTDLGVGGGIIKINIISPICPISPISAVSYS
jgi:hypothetical protein